jgi:general stress protein YciG
MAKEKNPHAVALRKLAGSKPGLARTANLTPEELSEIGRKGGLAGGRARAKKLTKAQRKESARKAAEARWEKKTKGK